MARFLRVASLLTTAKKRRICPRPVVAGMPTKKAAGLVATPPKLYVRSG
jgi:hypothetical protein